MNTNLQKSDSVGLQNIANPSLKGSFKLSVLNINLMILLLGVFIFPLFLNTINAQTTVFSDDFNRAALSPGGTPSMTYSSTLNSTGAVVNMQGTYLKINTQLSTVNNKINSVAGVVSAVGSPYNSTLHNNTGIVTWTFNLRWNRGSNNPTNIGYGYGIAVILAATNNVFETVSLGSPADASGYAVVYGSGTSNTLTDRKIRLVKFADGINSTTIPAVLTDIISVNSGMPTANGYMSVRVTFAPSTDTWSLYFRSDGATAWTDAATGVTSQVSTSAVDNTYTGSELTHFGFAWSNGNTTSIAASGDFDNFKITIADPPTIGSPSVSLLSDFSTTTGTVSASKTFTIGGTNLHGALVVNAPTDFEVRENEIGLFSSSVSFTPTDGTVSSKTIEVRIKSTATAGTPSGNVVISSTNATSQNVAVSGTVAAAAGPVIAVGAITDFGNQLINTSSTEKSYIVSGTNLTDNLIITPPVGFEISETSGSGFISNPNIISLTPTSGSVADKTIYVRFSPTTTGSFSANISHTATDATTKNVALTGYGYTGGHYRSKASGNWNDLSTWESAEDNINFIDASLVPNVNSEVVSVLNGHTVSLPSSLTIDQLNVNTGGILELGTGSTLTLEGANIINGTFNTAGLLTLNTGNTTLVVNGVYNRNTGAGNIVNNSTATTPITFGAGSFYSHNVNGGDIPVASYNASSNLEVTGITNTFPSFKNTVIYGNVKWNCPNQSQNINLNNFMINVAGDLSIMSTGSFALRLTASINIIVSVSGNLNLSGGTLHFSNGSSYTNQVLNVGGWNQTGGTFAGNTSTGNPLSLNFTGTNSSFVQTSGNFTTTNINVALNSGKTLTLLNNLSVETLNIASTATLNVSAGKQLTVSGELANNGTLNLLSTGSGTATLTAGSTSGSGTANVSQYLSTARNWYVASPVTGAALPSTGYTLFQRNEANASWPTPTGTFTQGKGYIAYPDAAASTLTFSGQLNMTGVTVPLTWAGTSSKGYNLIGNPYPSHLTWTADFVDDVTNAEIIEPTIWIRTNSGSSNTGGWSFLTYNGHSGEAAPSSSILTGGIIPPMQAFWVRALKADNLVLDSKLTRSHQASNALKAPESKKSNRQRLRLQISNGIATDEALIYFDANAANAYDRYDSPKMSVSNSAVEIFSLVGTERLVINGLKELKYDAEIPIGFTTTSASNVNISAIEMSNFESGTRLIIKNNQTLAETELSEGVSFGFSTQAATTSSNLFSLIFRTSSSITDLKRMELNTQVYVNAANQITVQLNEVPENAVVKVYSALGQLLANKVITESSTVLNRISEAGVYFVSILRDGNAVTKKVIIN